MKSSNSDDISVTFTLPPLAAARLKELMDSGDRTLRDLGVLSVEINEGAGQQNQRDNNQLSSPRNSAHPGAVHYTSTLDKTSLSCPLLPSPDALENTRKNIQHYLNSRPPPPPDHASVTNMSMERRGGHDSMSRFPEPRPATGHNPVFQHSPRFSHDRGARPYLPEPDPNSQKRKSDVEYWKSAADPSFWGWQPSNRMAYGEIAVDGYSPHSGLARPVSPMYARSPPYAFSVCSPRLRAGFPMQPSSSYAEPLGHVEHERPWQHMSHSTTSPYLMNLLHSNSSHMTKSQQHVSGPFEPVLALPPAPTKRKLQRNRNDGTGSQQTGHVGEPFGIRAGIPPSCNRLAAQAYGPDRGSYAFPMATDFSHMTVPGQSQFSGQPHVVSMANCMTSRVPCLPAYSAPAASHGMSLPVAVSAVSGQIFSESRCDVSMPICATTGSVQIASTKSNVASSSQVIVTSTSAMSVPAQLASSSSCAWPTAPPVSFSSLVTSDPPNMLFASPIVPPVTMPVSTPVSAASCITSALAKKPDTQAPLESGQVPLRHLPPTKLDVSLALAVLGATPVQNAVSFASVSTSVAVVSSESCTVLPERPLILNATQQILTQAQSTVTPAHSGSTTTPALQQLSPTEHCTPMSTFKGVNEVTDVRELDRNAALQLSQAAITGSSQSEQVCNGPISKSARRSSSTSSCESVKNLHDCSSSATCRLEGLNEVCESNTAKSLNFESRGATLCTPNDISQTVIPSAESEDLRLQHKECHESSTSDSVAFPTNAETSEAGPCGKELMPTNLENVDAGQGQIQQMSTRHSSVTEACDSLIVNTKLDEGNKALFNESADLLGASLEPDASRLSDDVSDDLWIDISPLNDEVHGEQNAVVVSKETAAFADETKETDSCDGIQVRSETSVQTAATVSETHKTDCSPELDEQGSLASEQKHSTEADCAEMVKESLRETESAIEFSSECSVSSNGICERVLIRTVADDCLVTKSCHVLDKCQVTDNDAELTVSILDYAVNDTSVNDACKNELSVTNTLSLPSVERLSKPISSCANLINLRSELHPEVTSKLLLEADDFSDKRMSDRAKDTSESRRTSPEKSPCLRHGENVFEQNDEVMHAICPEQSLLRLEQDFGTLRSPPNAGNGGAPTSGTDLRRYETPGPDVLNLWTVEQNRRIVDCDRSSASQGTVSELSTFQDSVTESTSLCSTGKSTDVNCSPLADATEDVRFTCATVICKEAGVDEACLQNCIGETDFHSSPDTLDDVAVETSDQSASLKCPTGGYRPNGIVPDRRSPTKVAGKSSLCLSETSQSFLLSGDVGASVSRCGLDGGFSVTTPIETVSDLLNDCPNNCDNSSSSTLTFSSSSSRLTNCVESRICNSERDSSLDSFLDVNQTVSTMHHEVPCSNIKTVSLSPVLPPSALAPDLSSAVPTKSCIGRDALTRNRQDAGTTLSSGDDATFSQGAESDFFESVDESCNPPPSKRLRTSDTN